MRRRSGFVITETIIVAILGLISSFYGGAITEVETKGAVTSSINYDTNTTKCICVKKD